MLVATVIGLDRGAELPARTVIAAAVALAVAGAAAYGVLRSAAGSVDESSWPGSPPRSR